MEAVGDFYALIGVSPTASQDEIRKAYREVAGRFHPDINQSPAALLVFREISTAYETLSDPAKRAEYDRSRSDRLDESHLHFSILLSRSAVAHLHEPQLVYAMVTLDPPPEMIVGGDSTPLNLGLIIDRSTSMKGPRLDQVKAATNHIIDDLESQDVVSVVSFSDRADVVISATRPLDQRQMKATVSTMRASGATAMYEGLRGGLQELTKNLHPRYINHLVLITDGHTYGDAEACLELADRARDQGITISAMGIGEDWNDDFLDELASRTGGSSAYIASHRAVSTFIEDRVRSLGTAYAERAHLVVAPAPGAKLDSIFRVSPDPIPLSVDLQPIPLGLLDARVPTSLILQFSVSTKSNSDSKFHLGRASVHADILLRGHQSEGALTDIAVSIVDFPPETRPPTGLLRALSKVTLYRLQEHARTSLDRGDVDEATRSLQLLSTRLFEQGEEQLAQAAHTEAERVAATKIISDVGLKNLKYGTRALVQP